MAPPAPAPPAPEPLVVDAITAATLLGVSEWTLRRFIADGHLPVVTFPSTREAGARNRRVLLSVDDLRAFRDQYRQVQAQPDAALSAAAIKRWHGSGKEARHESLSFSR